MKTKRELIKEIKIDRSNLEHIARTGNINGSLLLSIIDVMSKYAEQESKQYAKWITNEVISGRTFKKLWNDYKIQNKEA